MNESVIVGRFLDKIDVVESAEGVCMCVRTGAGWDGVGGVVLVVRGRSSSKGSLVACCSQCQYVYGFLQRKWIVAITLPFATAKPKIRGRNLTI